VPSPWVFCWLAWHLKGIIQRRLYHLRKRRFLARSRPAAERHAECDYRLGWLRAQLL